MKRYILVFAAAMVAVWSMGANNSYTPVACKGSTITLTADSADNADFFQWYKDGVKIEGATNATLEVAVTDYTQHTYSVTSRVSDPQLGNNMFRNGGFEESVTNPLISTAAGFGSDYLFIGTNPDQDDIYTDDRKNNLFYLTDKRSELAWKDFYSGITAYNGSKYAIFDAGVKGRAWYAQTEGNPNLNLEAGKRYVFSYSAVNLNFHSPTQPVAPYDPAHVPTNEVLINQGFQVMGYFAVCIYFNRVGPHYDVVWAGTYNGWDLSNTTSMPHFVPVEGYPGWYAAKIPWQDNPKGKPIELTAGNGAFWDHSTANNYQFLTTNAELENGGDINNFSIRVTNASSAVICVSTDWREHQDYYKDTIDWNPAKLVFKVKNLASGGQVYNLDTIDLDCHGNPEHRWIRKQAYFTPSIDMTNVEINVTDETTAQMGNDFALDHIMFQLDNYDNARVVDSTVFVVEATTPEFTVTNPATECSDGTARTLTLGYSITNGAPFYYTIDYVNASIPDVDKTELTQKSGTGSISLSIPAGIYGTQNATLKITDKDGNCDASKNISFTLNKIPTLSIGTINNILSTATSVDIPYTVPSGSSAKTYSVHFTDSHFTNKNGSVSASGGNISVAISSGLTAGVYSGTLTVTSDDGCTKVYSISVTVADNLSVQFTNAQQKVCFGETSVFLPYVEKHGTPMQYTLSFSPAGNFTPVTTKTPILASPLSVSLNGTPAGTYTVTMTAYNADDQCTTSTQIVVSGTPSVIINDIADVCPGTPSVTAVFSFENADLYDYTFNGGTPVADQSTTGSGNIVIPTADLEAGTYMLSITPKSSDGCVGESASKLFTVLKKYNVDTTVVACKSFTWHGVTYTSTPTDAPTHNYGTVAGCDSIVTLKLTINPTYNVDTTAVACDSFTWHGVTYTSTPTEAPTHNYGTAAGCDSIVTLHLTVNKSKTSEEIVRNCGAYTWEGVEYTISGDYTETLVAANGCDSVVTLHLTVLNDSLMYTKWGNLVLCADRNRDIASYQWYINGAEVPGATGQYFTGDDRILTEKLSVRAITQTGDTLYSCEKTFAEMTTSPDQSKEEYTLPKNTPVRVYSISGRLMGTAEDNVGDVVGHLPAGIYILRWEDRAVRWVVY